MFKKNSKDVTAEVSAQLHREETENYAQHLARVMPDADCSKALLKARYKELHQAEHGGTDTD